MVGAATHEEPRRSSPFEMFGAFVPWIVYWILVGNVSFRVAVSIAFALTLANSVYSRVRGHPPKVLEVGGTVVFLLLFVVTFASDDRFLERWIQPLTNGGLFLVALASVLIGKPFTVQYAREQVPAEVAAMPGFLYINTVITWVWVAAFGVMTLASVVPPAVQGEATIREGGSTLAIVGYWVVPFVALGLAGLFSQRFPDWFTSHVGGPPGEDERATPAEPARLEPLDRPRAGSLELRAEPSRALIDQPVAISVHGAPPDAEVTLTATTLDAEGRRWQSQASFRAGADGAVDLATRAPGPGAYGEADPMGLVWSMRPAGDEVPEIFLTSLDAMALQVSAAVQDGPAVGLTLARLGLAPDVTRTDVRENGVIGTLFLPPGPGPHPGVALFPGSEGGLESQWLAAGVLASHGYATLIVGYFGVEGLPADLAEIPLERLAAGIAWLRARPEVDAGRVAAYGTSKGAEGVLAAAAHIEDLGLAAVVAVSPSHVAWQALGDEGPAPDTSSWTLTGAPLPFVPLRGEAVMPELLRNALLEKRDRRRHRPTLLHLAAVYSLEDEEAVARAALPVERIQAPILCLTGAEDELWPGPAMARAILARRGAAAGDHHEDYPHCGHLIRMPYFPTAALWTHGIAFGGTAAGLAAAQTDAGPRVLAFLAEHLGAPARTPSPR